MGGLTSMMNMSGLSRLFQRAQEGDENAIRTVKNLGPQLAGDAFLKKAEPMEEGLASNPFLHSLPEAHRAGPQSPQPLHETGQPMPGASSEIVSTKGPRDWATALSALSVGLTDLGNAIGNPRAVIQGGGYELSKQRLAEQQIQQLKSRQDLWDRTHQQAQAIPAEILAMPEMSALAQAKAALDRDLLDGKIDNEKNVSGFLTELERAKPQIEQFTLGHEVQNKAQEASLMRQEEEKLDSATRVRLEAAAAGGDLSARAKLTKLKAEELIPGKVGGMDLTLPASKWAEVRMGEADDAATAAWRTQQHEDNLAQIAATRSRIGESGRDRDTARASAALGSMVENSVRRYGKADENGELLNPEEAFSAGLVENEDAIVRAAKTAGINFKAPGEGAPDLGGSEQANYYYINGQVFSADDPKETAEALRLLYQLTRTY